MISTLPLKKLGPPIKRLAATALRLLHPSHPAPTEARSGDLPRHPFDLAHGLDTSGFIPGSQLVTGHPHDRYNTAYYAMSPSRFRSVVNLWRRDLSHAPIEDYTFVDLGSGKGRAVLMASMLPYREVIGVELHPDLAQVAQANVSKWTVGEQPRSPMKIVCREATEFTFPPGACLLYLFHPFGAPVMARLVRSLASQFRLRPGMLDVLYFNPEAANQIEQHGGFEHLWTELLPMAEDRADVDPLASADDRCSAYRWIGIDSGDPSAGLEDKTGR